MSTPTTSVQILNDIRDTIGNLVVKYKTLSTAETTTPADLKEIDKELGDCLNLLISLDTSMASLTVDQISRLISQYQTQSQTITDEVNETVTTALETLTTQKTQVFEQIDTKFTSVNELLTTIQTKLDNGDFKGDKGDTLVFDDLTQSQKDALRGLKGDPLTFEDLTPEQIDQLKVVNPENYFTKEDINALLAFKASTNDLQNKADTSALNDVIAILNSNNLDLDSFQEIVDFITINRENLNALSYDNLTNGVNFKKLSAELHTKLLNLRTNQENDLLLQDKANHLGSIEKTFKVATAQLPSEATNLLQVQQLVNQNSGNPVGTVITFASVTPPNGYLVCDGAVISRVQYSNLFSIIGETFGTGDGSTTFKIPNLRGEFIRGFDGGRGLDIGRAFGSVQLDSFREHGHNMKFTNSQSNTNYNNSTGSFMLNTSYLSAFTELSSLEKTGGTETRPRNIALQYCIKY